MRVGVLALQGDFEAHAKRFQEFGATTSLVKRASDLKQLQALSFPGGESSAMLKLMDSELKRGLIQSISSGLPTFATCAGVILLAQHVFSPEQESLGVLDVDVERNAYGRQVDSSIQEINWTREGKVMLSTQAAGASNMSHALEGVFIRAPKIVRVGSGVKVILECKFDPVLVVQNKIFAATFHPELSTKALAVHKLFLDQLVRAN